MGRSQIGILAAYLMLCGTAGASPSMEAISKVVAAATAIQGDIAMAQKRFSVMSRELAETERCAARELLGTSIDFRQVTDQAIVVGRIVGEMKSVEDQSTLRRHLGQVAYHVAAIGENDIELVNDLMANLTTPEAIAGATVLRDKMIEVRDLLKPLASERP